MSGNGERDRSQMSIDERLKFLLESTESLHDQMAQFIEEGRQQRETLRQQWEREDAGLRRLDSAEKQHRRAVLAAMQSYLNALDADEGEEG